MTDSSGDRTPSESISWECRECGERYYKSKSACMNCGSGKITTVCEGSGDLSTFFRRLSIPEFLALVLGLASVFLAVFFAIVFLGV